MKLNLASVLAALLCCGVAGAVAPANAAPAPLSDSITIFLPGMGASVTSTLLEGSAQEDNGSVITLILPGSVTQLPNEFTQVVLTETACQPNCLPSDASDVIYTLSGLTIFMVSDATGFPAVPLDGLTTFSILETGSPQDISSFFGLADHSIVVQSDIDVVPIPAALPLFATGIGAMGLLGWRRKRKAFGEAA